MRQSHGVRTMIVRPPYDLAFLSQLVSLSYAVFLFYTFEVQSQLKMISCTSLITKFKKFTRITQPSNDLHTAYVRESQGCRATSVRFLCTAAEIAR